MYVLINYLISACNSDFDWLKPFVYRREIYFVGGG